MSHSAVVLFDAECPACRALAAWAEARAAGGDLAFTPWQEFTPTAEAAGLLTAAQRSLPADKLRLLRAGVLLEGAEAWEELVRLHPSFTQINWMARNLGLARPEAPAGRALMRAGQIVRRLCLRCPRPAAR